MADINEALIKKVADLARLELSEAEVQNYVSSIGDILKHVEQLSEVDVTGIEPMVYGIDENLRFRADQVVELGLSKDGKPKILESAPEVLYDGFKVPQIIG